MKIEGVIPPLMTPLDGDGGVDEGGVKRLIRHVLDGGAAGVFVQGSAGEFPMIARTDRAGLIAAAKCAIIEHWKEKPQGPVPPLLAGCSSCTTRETLRLIEEARDVGADAAVVLSPYYYKLRTPVLVRYLGEVADRSALPVVMYENPHTMGNLLPVDELLRLGTHGNVRGLKDSAGDFARFLRLVNEFPKPVLQGNTAMMLASVASGAAGLVPGIANLFPRKCVELFELARAGKLDEARALEGEILAARETIFPDGKWREGLKYALSVRGLIEPHCAEPHDELTGEEKKRIGQVASGVDS